MAVIKEAPPPPAVKRGLLKRLLLIQKGRTHAPSHLVSIPRNAMASLIATSAEAIMLPTLTELVGLYYMVSLVCGMLTATTISFFLNKYWVFEAREGLKRWQYVKQILVAVGSFVGNGGLVFVLTEYVGLHYMVSFVCAGVTVFFCWNYPASRRFVFSDGHRERRPARRG